MSDPAGRLSGNQSQVVDSKNRLVIPAKFREVLGNVVKVGLDPQDNFFVLTVCSPAVYQERMSALEKRAETDPQLSNTITFLDATTEEMELDEQGRITLTGELKGSAGVERDVVVIGRGNHLQIWTQGRWEDFRKKAFDAPGGMRESIFRRSQ
jgi:MraZ protein